MRRRSAWRAADGALRVSLTGLPDEPVLLSPQGARAAFAHALDGHPTCEFVRPSRIAAGEGDFRSVRKERGQ